MSKRHAIGVLVLALTLAVHLGVFWVRRPPPVCGTVCGVMWKASDPRPAQATADPPILTRYVQEKRILMGLSYGLALGFTAYAAARTFGTSGKGAAGVLGGLTLTGFLATAGCFLVGCCGSPMLTVYLALFGSAMLGFKEVVVLALTIVSVAVAFVWMEKRQPGTCACTPGCACAAPDDADTKR